MQRLDTGDADFDAALEQLTAWNEELDASVNETVTAIIAAISSRLVVNKAAMRSKHVPISRVIADLTATVKDAENATA